MTGSWYVIVGQLVAVILGGAGVTQLINSMFQRRAVRVDSAARLNESTLKWAEELQRNSHSALEEARQARSESIDARLEVAELHRQLRKVRAEAQVLVDHFHNMVRLIHEPHMTMERLRTIVDDPGPNGLFSIDGAHWD